ncbi:MAG: EI24 domain-containing protein [Acetobacteraceae bacterium]|nr:EI24 domain-containing protein [Acetobacteraceae bacterium]
MIFPALRAIAQLPDPAFFGAVLRSVVWSVIGFAVLSMTVSLSLHAGIALWLASFMQHAEAVGWAAALVGFFSTTLLSVWLFVPVSTAIASLFSDRIADAVERRYYPSLPYAAPAPIAAQVTDAVLLGGRVLLLQAVAGVVTVIPPHVTGLALGWIVSSWAVGRGLFVPVAMRRMDRAHAVLVYRQRRTEVMLLGATIVAAGLVPLLNLFAPILGVAAMVHVLHSGSQVRVVMTPPVV